MLIGDLRRSRATKLKGGTLCISKSKEWNGLALRPIRATYPTSLIRVKCVALPNPALLSGLHAGLLVLTDDLYMHCNIVLLLFFPSLVVLEEVSNRGEQ